MKLKGHNGSQKVCSLPFHFSFGQLICVTKYKLNRWNVRGLVKYKPFSPSIFDAISLTLSPPLINVMSSDVKDCLKPTLGPFCVCGSHRHLHATCIHYHTLEEEWFVLELELLNKLVHLKKIQVFVYSRFYIYRHGYAAYTQHLSLFWGWISQVLKEIKLRQIKLSKQMSEVVAVFFCTCTINFCPHKRSWDQVCRSVTPKFEQTQNPVIGSRSQWHISLTVTGEGGGDGIGGRGGVESNRDRAHQTWHTCDVESRG